MTVLIICTIAYFMCISFYSIKSYQKTKKTMKQEMKNYLLKEGFHPEESRDREKIIFKREGLSFVYFNHKREDKFLSIVLPHICDVKQDSRLAILEAANLATQDMRVGKVVIIEDSVWCIYERFLTSQDSLEEICPRAFDMLASARMRFYEILENNEGKKADGSIN